MKKKSLILVLAVFLGTVGCIQQRLMDLTVVSTKQTRINVSKAGKGDRVEGEDRVYYLIFIPLGKPDLKEAIDRAIESAGPEYDALVDCVVYSHHSWWILSGYSAIKIVGTAIKTSEVRTALLLGKRVLFHSSLGIANEG